MSAVEAEGQQLDGRLPAGGPCRGHLQATPLSRALSTGLRAPRRCRHAVRRGREGQHCSLWGGRQPAGGALLGGHSGLRGGRPRRRPCSGSNPQRGRGACPGPGTRQPSRVAPGCHPPAPCRPSWMAACPRPSACSSSTLPWTRWGRRPGRAATSPRAERSGAAAGADLAQHAGASHCVTCLLPGPSCRSWRHCLQPPPAAHGGPACLPPPAADHR